MPEPLPRLCLSPCGASESARAPRLCPSFNRHPSPSRSKREIDTIPTLAGVLSKLTNSYCLVATQGSTNATNFYSAFESELGDVIPIVHTSTGGTCIVRHLTTGNMLPRALSLSQWSCN
ncbi:hypothetical protein DFH94DRAFT_660285 [Russula ochroleuca]|uniref:Uncharacterized protein n=1 Tax=Russula ochroleuca TaxID=152965 RepID=A0A9P5N6E2_9AGAM|nr:hypothetical protein DFH94DRAFT_660285 [Russula ochroleuca]